LVDFIITDPSESTARVELRTDLSIGSNSNFTIMQRKGLGEGAVQPWMNKKRAALAAFPHRGLYTNKQTIIAFCTLWGLNLVQQDANGDNQVTLVSYLSDAGASSW